jgi:hypothetical protein
MQPCYPTSVIDKPNALKHRIMKNLNLLALVAFVFCLCAAFTTQKGEPITSERKVSDFTTLNVSGGFGASKLEYGATPSVKIITEEKWLQYVVTENKGDDLSIYFKKGAPNGIRASLVVTYKQLSEINNSGSTDFTCSGLIQGKSLTLNYSGSGDFSSEVSVDKLEINVSGSSDMSLRGQAKKQEYAISGSGDIHAESLKGESAEVAISGSGDVELHINGSVETSTSGSGRVRNRN